MWGKCKVCAEKDRRILDLKDQISVLRRQLLPVNSSNPTVTSLEMDGVMSGQQHIIEIPETAEEIAEARERDRLLSGQYDA